jgi:hypothetical protein
MKNLTLINNEWKERVNPNTTVEEKIIIENREDKSENRKSVIDAIRSRSFIEVSQEESTKAQNIYDANKIENAELISVDISLPDGYGIINCRVNGEHKQIRF